MSPRYLKVEMFVIMIISQLGEQRGHISNSYGRYSLINLHQSRSIHWKKLNITVDIPNTISGIKPGVLMMVKSTAMV